MSPTDTLTETSWTEAQALLGVSSDASDAELRAAYMAKVRQHPPDRDPETFERIRDAYERLRDPRVRAQRVLAAPQPDGPISALLEGMPPGARRFVGPSSWLELLKEKRP